MNVSRPPVTKHVNNATSITTTTNGSIADIDEDEYTALIYDSIIDDLLVKRRIVNNSISLSSDSYYHDGGSVYSAFSSTDISMRKKSIDAVVTRHNHSKGICNGVTSNKGGRNNKLRPAVHKKPSIVSAATSSSHVRSSSMIISTSTDDASEMGQHYLNSIDRSQSTLSDMDNSISMRSARDIVNNSASLDGDGEISSSQAFYLEVERCTAGIRAKLQMIDDLDHLDSSSSNNNSLEDPTPPTVSELMSPVASLQSRDSSTYSIMHNNIDSAAVVIGHEMVATISSDSIPTLATSRTETVEAAVGTADDDDEDDDDGSSLLSGPSVSMARRNRSIEPVCLTEEASTNASATSPSSLAYVEAEISILTAVAPVLPPKAMTPLPHWVQRMNSTEIYDNIADVDDSITMNSLINFKYAMADIGIKDLALMTSSTADDDDDDDDDDRADGGVGENMKEEGEYAQVMSSLMNDAMRVKGLSISGECRYHASSSTR